MKIDLQHEPTVPLLGTYLKDSNPHVTGMDLISIAYCSIFTTAEDGTSPGPNNGGVGKRAML